jgi:AI-2 transport protein TqsA
MGSIMSDAAGWARKDSLRTAAYGVVMIAGAWWLLGQWAGVLRPLLLAVFMGYTLMPFYSRLRRSGFPAPVVIATLAMAGFAGLAVLAVILSTTSRELQRELPALQARFHDLTAANLALAYDTIPWLPRWDGDPGSGEEIATLVQKLLGTTAGGLLEAATAGLYLLFILIGAEKIPGRIRMAYGKAEGDRLLDIAGGINSAIICYLRAKVISSLLLAGATGAVLLLFGVKFVTAWVLLTFLCNFIPYVGSVISFVLPVLYAVLQLPPWTGPLAVAGLLLVIQVVSATLVEPLLIGRAVGLSPLVILAALAIWGTVWGLPGMFLAVPLTVVLRIVLENIPGTRPIATMMAE